MKLKVIISALFFLTLIPLSIAQEKSEESSNSNQKSAFADRFFMAITTSTYTDFITSPLTFNYASTGTTFPDGTPKYADIPFQSMEMNILSFGLEPRFNLKEFDENSSLSISAPISFGIGSSGSAAGDPTVVNGVEGFGSIQVPLLLKLNLGNGATYTTQKDYGFSVGGGLEVNKIGLIALNEKNSQYNKAFVLPCFSAGFTFMRGDSPMEVNLKYAFGKVDVQEINSEGFMLKDTAGVPYQRNTRGQSIKLSFVYLLNY